MTVYHHYSRQISTPNYNLKLALKQNYLKLTMQLDGMPYTTHKMPHVTEILKARLPSIFRCRCFNNEHLPFSQEMKKTEIGHLYEHVMLEYLARLLSAKGIKQSKVKGVTTWNWHREKPGTFHIKINVGEMEAALIDEAIYKTDRLFKHLINEDLALTSCRIN